AGSARPRAGSASLTLREPPPDVAVRRGGVIPVHDLLILGIALVPLPLPERGPRLVERLLGGAVVLGADGLERPHDLAGGGGDLEVVAVGEEGVDPGLAPGLADPGQDLRRAGTRPGIDLAGQAVEPLPRGAAGLQGAGAVQRGDGVAVALGLEALLREVEQ